MITKQDALFLIESPESPKVAELAGDIVALFDMLHAVDAENLALRAKLTAMTDLMKNIDSRYTLQPI